MVRLIVINALGVALAKLGVCKSIYIAVNIEVINIVAFAVIEYAELPWGRVRKTVFLKLDVLTFRLPVLLASTQSEDTKLIHQAQATQLVQTTVVTPYLIELRCLSGYTLFPLLDANLSRSQTAK